MASFSKKTNNILSLGRKVIASDNFRAGFKILSFGQSVYSSSMRRDSSIALHCGVSKGSALRLRLTGSTAQPCVSSRELLIGSWLIA